MRGVGMLAGLHKNSHADLAKFSETFDLAEGRGD